MIELLDGLTPWHWLCLGAVLLGARILMPLGMAFTIGQGVLILGTAATITGLAVLADATLTGLQQIGLAAFATMASCYGLGRWAGRDYRAAERHLDQIFILTRAIVAGRGELEIEHETWPVRGGDLPAGARVKVIGVAEQVRIARLGTAGRAGGEATLEPGAPVQVVGTELTLEVEPA